MTQNKTWNERRIRKKQSSFGLNTVQQLEKERVLRNINKTFDEDLKKQINPLYDIEQSVHKDTLKELRELFEAVGDYALRQGIKIGEQNRITKFLENIEDGKAYNKGLKDGEQKVNVKLIREEGREDGFFEGYDKGRNWGLGQTELRVNTKLYDEGVKFGEQKKAEENRKAFFKWLEGYRITVRKDFIMFNLDTWKELKKDGKAKYEEEKHGVREC